MLGHAAGLDGGGIVWRSRQRSRRQLGGLSASPTALAQQREPLRGQELLCEPHLQDGELKFGLVVSFLEVNMSCGRGGGTMPN